MIVVTVELSVLLHGLTAGASRRSGLPTGQTSDPTRAVAGQPRKPQALDVSQLRCDGGHESEPWPSWLRGRTGEASGRPVREKRSRLVTLMTVMTIVGRSMPLR